MIGFFHISDTENGSSVFYAYIVDAAEKEP